MVAPEWLTRRDGSLKIGSDGKTWFVLLRNQPQYSLQPVPAGGQHGCAVRQTINGRLVESPGIYATADQALAAGLDELRKSLGWD